MRTFATARDAMEYLAERICSQAQRDGTPLSEIERKMLYFSETAWTLPDIAEVNEEFGRRYDQDEYEGKIAELARRAARDSGLEAPSEWEEAVRLLRREDRYLLVLIGDAARRPPGDLLRLVLVATAIVAAFVAAAVFFAGRR